MSVEKAMSVDNDELIAGWVDETLSDAACGVLLARVEADPTVAEALLHAVRMEQLLALAHGPGPDLAPAVLAGLRDHGSRQRLRAAVLRRLPERRRRQRSSGAPWLIAASLLVALGALGVLLTLRQTPAPPEAPLAVAPPRVPAPVVSAPVVPAPTSAVLATITSATPGSGLRVGQTIATGDTVRLALSGTAELSGPGWVLTLDPGSAVQCADANALRLLAGALHAEVAPHDPAHPLVFSTAQAQATVIGTGLRLEQGANRTLLEVTHGKVRLAAHETAVDTVSGQIALADGVTPVRALAWTPLFTGDLGTWEPVYGTWTNVGGEVSGSGRARLSSRLPHGDLELHCQVRVSGAEFGEFQLGDYNWFIEIPQRAEWTTLRVSQHGSAMHATLDGRPVELQAGDGQPARRGSVAFYVRGGGIAIREAVLAE